MKSNFQDLICDSRFFEKGEIKQSFFVECLRWQNLVYVRTLKCASEFFYRNFAEVAGWQPINWQDINWGCDHVFSYMMDPIMRRHKGIAEFVISHQLKDALFNDPAVGKLISHVPFLDEHSAGMITLYGKRVNQIDWIPLSPLDHTQGIRYTNVMLAYFKHPPVNWNKEYVHQTDMYMSELYQRVKSLWHETHNELAVNYYFERELRLYQQVHQQFNYTGETWDRISWLTNV